MKHLNTDPSHKKAIKMLAFEIHNGDSNIFYSYNRLLIPLDNLLLRLLNESYTGKKMLGIIIEFGTEQNYKSFPNITPNTIEYVYTQLRYYGTLDFEIFSQKDPKEQHRYLWEKSYEYLNTASKLLKNEQLLKANEYAYRKGLETNLCLDYEIVATNVILYGRETHAAVWAKYEGGFVKIVLMLTHQNAKVFEQQIDETNWANQFLDRLIRNIEVLNETKLVVKGHRDAGYPKWFQIPPFF